MKRHLHSMKRSKARLVAFIAVLSILVGGAVTVVSRQSDRAATSGAQQPGAVTNPKLARATVQDKSIPQTTPIQEITPEEAQRLTEAVKPMVSKSTDGLVESIDADGGVAIDVKDRFQNVTVARRNADGSISYSCVDTPESASAFFQPSRSPKQAGAGTRTAPVRR